jgi:hypothetical protein
MPDSVLVQREEATDRLRAEAFALQRRLASVESYRKELEVSGASSARQRNAMTMVRELRQLGFSVEASTERGVIRLGLTSPVKMHGEKLDARTISRLSRAASLLREFLPNHELSIESNDLGRAVAAVRALNETAGVPGLRLRAMTGSEGALMVEVRPTQVEALQEVLATAD